MIMIMILKFIIITVINYYHNILYSKLGNIYFYLSYKLKRKQLSTNERADLKLGQEKMTNMLRIFDQVCRKYKLKYWVCSGTLIGTVRHKGWIPHDADIDVCMVKDDYDKLSKIIQKELPKEMWFQSPETDPFYAIHRNKSILGKIRHLDYCYIDDKCQDIHNGIQIDIFVFEKNNNKLEIVRMIPDIFSMNYNDVFPLKELYFEGIKVYVQNNYDSFLKKVWGGNPPPLLPKYRQYPPEGRIGKTLEWIKEKYPHLYQK